MLGCEFPLDALLRTEVGNQVLRLPFALKLMDVDRFSSGAYEIGSVVAPDGLPHGGIYFRRVVK